MNCQPHQASRKEAVQLFVEASLSLASRISLNICNHISMLSFSCKPGNWLQVRSRWLQVRSKQEVPPSCFHHVPRNLAPGEVQWLQVKSLAPGKVEVAPSEVPHASCLKIHMGS